MDLISLFKALLKRKWLILTVTLIASVLAFLLTLDMKKSYLSKAQLATGYTVNDPFDDDKYNLFEVKVKFSNLTASIASPMVINLLSYKLIINDLQKRKPFRKITNEDNLARLKTINTQEAIGIFEEKLENLEPLSTYNETDKELIELLKIYRYDDESIRESLRIWREGQTDYLTVTFSSEHPELSAYAVNTLCSEFFRYNDLMQYQRQEESIATFEKLLEQKRQILEVKSQSLERFKSRQGVLNFDVESESKIEQISKAELALSEEKQKINRLTLSLENVNRRLRELNDALSGNGTGNLVNNSNEELLELQEQIRALNQRYTSTGLQDQTLQDSLNILRNKKIALINSNSSGRLSKNDLQTKKQELTEKKNDLEIELAIAQQNRGTLESSVRSLKSNAGVYASKEAQIAAMKKEVTLATNEYQTAQEKYNTALDMSMASRNKIRQVLYGQPSIEPEPSKRLIITALSGASTFAISVIAIFFLIYMDMTIKTPSNLANMLGVKMLGAVNQLDLKNTPIREIFYQENSKNPLFTTFREMLRKLRFMIDRQNAKTFLVTSTQHGGGKSTLIEALACALSLSKNKVMILDTNFSNNQLTQRFKASPVLEEAVDARPEKFEELQDLITKTGIPDVHIMGCKGGNYSPSELFHKQDFNHFLALLDKHYDYIFLEGAAMNQHSDSKELSLYADRILVTFSARGVIKQADRESIKFLEDLEEKFTGAVLNQVELENIEQ
ncbi:Wzz/FepE/Etk N-terminal domain-containing protein [Rapidithrix thailandica]|uniref:Wzz/FepE/Etk N-terminal domain-containing protein n=1 Tax=Rapidithrix thailandica TaxID=413964 RepID=A0AAW9SE16_9BACT